MEVAGTKGRSASYCSTEQLRRPREIGCLLAQPLGHINGVSDPARQK
jgi:hypothetical protein